MPKQVMLRSSSLQWRRGRTSGHAGSLTPEILDCKNRKESLPKSTDTTMRRLCRSLGKDADYQKCAQENSCTNKTMEGWDRIAKVDHRKIHKMTRQQRQAQFGYQVVHCSDLSRRIQHGTPRVHILSLDRLTVFARNVSPTQRAGYEETKKRKLCNRGHGACEQRSRILGSERSV